MIGVAVGLGNVWRFPYMMGSYGGSAFLIVYLAFVVLFGIPALMGEWALGRATRHGPLGAFTAALGRWGHAIGWLLLLTVTVANSYYIVVVANVAYTAWHATVRGFTPEAIDDLHHGLNHGPTQIMMGLMVIGAAWLVLTRGLHRGIERVSKMFVPFFGVVVVLLIIHSLRLPGATTALVGFLRPDFASMTPTNVFAAMGQAFFSLSLGGTFYLIYGSYLRDDEVLPRAAIFTATGDVGAALLAALFIVPTTLAFGLDLDSGPRLIFETLPALFQSIPAGRGLGATFLVALFTMAFLSSVAAFQVIVGAMTDSWRIPRRVALLAAAGIETVLMVPSAVRPSLIGPLDLVFGSGMQVLGSGLALVALAWGLGRTTTLAQIFGRTSGVQPTIFFAWIRWVVPAALLVTLGLYVATV